MQRKDNSFDDKMCMRNQTAAYLLSSQSLCFNKKKVFQLIFNTVSNLFLIDRMIEIEIDQN